MMADIALCNGEGCDHKDSCMRFYNYKSTTHPWKNYIYSKSCIEHDYVAYIGEL